MERKHWEKNKYLVKKKKAFGKYIKHYFMAYYNMQVKYLLVLLWERVKETWPLPHLT